MRPAGRLHLSRLLFEYWVDDARTYVRRAFGRDYGKMRRGIFGRLPNLIYGADSRLVEYARR